MPPPRERTVSRSPPRRSATPEDDGGEDDAASSVDTELQAESGEADAGTGSEARMAALRAWAIPIKRDEDDAAEMARRNE
eukprot:9103010-Pyramimonas_sp.AAC.1